MYHQLPMLTASLASRLSDRQDATFLLVWFLSLGFCLFCYIEINIRNCFSMNDCFHRCSNWQTKRSSFFFFGHWCDSAPGFILIWSPIQTGLFSFGAAQSAQYLLHSDCVMVDQPQKLSARHNCYLSVSKLIKVTQFNQWFVHKNKIIIELSHHVA